MGANSSSPILRGRCGCTESGSWWATRSKWFLTRMADERGLYGDLPNLILQNVHDESPGIYQSPATRRPTRPTRRTALSYQQAQPASQGAPRLTHLLPTYFPTTYQPILCVSLVSHSPITNSWRTRCRLSLVLDLRVLVRFSRRHMCLLRRRGASSRA